MAALGKAIAYSLNAAAVVEGSAGSQHLDSAAPADPQSLGLTRLVPNSTSGSISVEGAFAALSAQRPPYASRLASQGMGKKPGYLSQSLQAIQKELRGPGQWHSPFRAFAALAEDPGSQHPYGGSRLSVT